MLRVRGRVDVGVDGGCGWGGARCYCRFGCLLGRVKVLSSRGLYVCPRPAGLMRADRLGRDGSWLVCLWLPLFVLWVL